jgi:hypothetical protein
MAIGVESQRPHNFSIVESRKICLYLFLPETTKGGSMYFIFKPLFLFFSMFFMNFVVLAQKPENQEAESIRIRQLIEIAKSPNQILQTHVNSIILPVSPCLTQGGSSLCWNFAGMNILETNYRAQNPNSAFQLSRRAVYAWIAFERNIKRLSGAGLSKVERPTGSLPFQFFTGPNQNNTRGTTIDAIRYASIYGLIPLNLIEVEVTLPLNSYRLFEVKTMEFEGFKSLINFVDAVSKEIGVIPESFEFEGQSVKPKELATQILGNKNWTSYAILRNRPDNSTVPNTWLNFHVDRDNHLGDRSFAISHDRLPSLIKESLQNQNAMEISMGGHSVMLYGADYDETTGLPIRYYLKDSYGDCLYTSNPERTHMAIYQITTGHRIQEVPAL